VQAGTAVVFNGNVWTPASSDSDSFIFAYSTDDSIYIDMFTVTATEDDNNYHTFALPSSTSGTVFIRVTDTDRNQGHLELNTVYVDHLFIRTELLPGDTPSAPTGLAATPISSSSIELAWVDNADNENGYKIERSPNGSSDWVSIDTLNPDTESYIDTGLEAETTYSYRAIAFNNYGDSNPSNTASATTAEGTSMHVCDLDDESSLSKTSRWDAVVIITVYDESLKPVVGATAIGSWSSGATGTGSGITDDQGQCRITKSNLKSNVSSVIFTVEDVTIAGYTYVPVDNYDPDGDSDGTTITLFNP
jgi:hypothetical protein